jgi:hypothetical protein
VPLRQMSSLWMTGAHGGNQFKRLDGRERMVFPFTHLPNLILPSL